MKEIDGAARTIRELLQNARFSVDYYQREYRWQEKHITELLNDLFGAFNESYSDGDDRVAVSHYGHYFLGSIIISDKEGKKFLIDGQQRITSLSLLLIAIYRRLQDDDQRSVVAPLIYSYKSGAKSFNLDVPERAACVECLFNGQGYDDAGDNESVTTILARFDDIVEQLNDGIEEAVLPYFSDWLIENVHLIEITALSDSDAYTIFETMNDRGLSLTPTDMLKGYLLANITTPEKRLRASEIWRKRINGLNAIGKDEDADGIKSWLRSQQAQTIRERRRGAVPLDFDLIGTEFHRWIKDHEDKLGLAQPSDFSRLIEQDFAFYTKQYQRIREATIALDESLPCIYYAGQHKFTLQYPVLLAPLSIEDTDAAITSKLRITSTFIDIMLARRIWNYRMIAYSTMQYSMFTLTKEIRGKSIDELTAILKRRLNEETDASVPDDRFHLHGTNGRQIHWLLARITDFIQTGSGQTSRYQEYSSRSGKHGYEIEHIWANHPERHTDEFEHAADFSEWRNRLGDLVLLPKSFNASYGDMPYEEKQKHYVKQNILAQSLHERAYENNPGFKRFREQHNLQFEPHPKFHRVDLESRHRLYQELCGIVWDPARVLQAAN